MERNRMKIGGQVRVVVPRSRSVSPTDAGDLTTEDCNLILNLGGDSESLTCSYIGDQ